MQKPKLLDQVRNLNRIIGGNYVQASLTRLGNALFATSARETFRTLVVPVGSPRARFTRAGDASGRTSGSAIASPEVIDRTPRRGGFTADQAAGFGNTKRGYS